MRNVVVGATFEKQRHHSRQMQLNTGHLPRPESFNKTGQMMQATPPFTRCQCFPVGSNWWPRIAQSTVGAIWIGKWIGPSQVPRMVQPFTILNGTRNHHQFSMDLPCTKIDHGFHILPGGLPASPHRSSRHRPGKAVRRVRARPVPRGNRCPWGHTSYDLGDEKWFVHPLYIEKYLVSYYLFILFILMTFLCI